MSPARMIRCNACGANNRVPQERLDQGLKPVCGRCKAPLSESSGKPIKVTDATFADLVESSSLPVLLDFWAPWCGPCRLVAPVLEDLAAELAGRIRIAKLNVDENPATSARFQVRSIPTLLIFKGGREIDRMVGAQSKSEISRRLENHLIT
jgi:thioredoxin 2